jgi:tetratricopeptide (TPR) repeat protein
VDAERVQTLEKLMALDPADSFSPYALGLEYACSEPDRALGYFRDALGRDKDLVGAYFQAARVEVERGNLEAARDWFGQAKDAAERTKDWHAHGEIEDALAEIS